MLDLGAGPAALLEQLDALSPLLQGHDALLDHLDQLALLTVGLGEDVLATGVGELREEPGRVVDLDSHRLVDRDHEGVLPALASGDPPVVLLVHLTGVLLEPLRHQIHLAGGPVGQGRPDPARLGAGHPHGPPLLGPVAHLAPDEALGGVVEAVDELLDGVQVVRLHADAELGDRREHVGLVEVRRVTDVDDPLTGRTTVQLDQPVRADALAEVVQLEPTEVQTPVLRPDVGVLGHAVVVRLQVLLSICTVALACHGGLEDRPEGLGEAVGLGVLLSCSDQVVDLTVHNRGQQTEATLEVGPDHLFTLTLEPSTQQGDVVVTRHLLGEHQRTAVQTHEADPVLQGETLARRDHLDDGTDLLTEQTLAGDEEVDVVVVVFHGTSKPA